MVADIFTKALGEEEYLKFRAVLMNEQLSVMCSQTHWEEWSSLEGELHSSGIGLCRTVCERELGEDGSRVILPDRRERRVAGDP
jgi:hypothetical protein